MRGTMNSLRLNFDSAPLFEPTVQNSSREHETLLQGTQQTEP